MKTKLLLSAVTLDLGACTTLGRCSREGGMATVWRSLAGIPYRVQVWLVALGATNAVSLVFLDTAAGA